MSESRSQPALWIVWANSICFVVRFRSRLSARSRARISRLLSGVRSSWLMFARNSDLYWLDAASCSAFSSRPSRAISISRFLISMLRFCSDSRLAFSSSSALVRCSSTDWTCSSWASRWLCASSSSVRAFAMIVLSTTPIVPTSCSRKLRCRSENAWKDASSMTPSTCSSKRTGVTTTSAGGADAQPGVEFEVSLRNPRHADRALLDGRLADQPLARLERERRHAPPAPRSWT